MGAPPATVLPGPAHQFSESGNASSLPSLKEPVCVLLAHHFSAVRFLLINGCYMDDGKLRVGGTLPVHAT